MHTPVSAQTLAERASDCAPGPCPRRVIAQLPRPSPNATLRDVPLRLSFSRPLLPLPTPAARGPSSRATVYKASTRRAPTMRHRISPPPRGVSAHCTVTATSQARPGLWPYAYILPSIIRRPIAPPVSPPCAHPIIPLLIPFFIITQLIVSPRIATHPFISLLLSDRSSDLTQPSPCTSCDGIPTGNTPYVTRRRGLTLTVTDAPCLCQIIPLFSVRTEQTAFRTTHPPRPTMGSCM